MLNFEFYNLRIVSKKEWKPTSISIKNSAGAEKILKKAGVYKTLEDAVKDLHFVYATTNRRRSLNSKAINLKQAISLFNKQKKTNIGIVFGPERSGLSNDDITLCDKIINIPANINFNSLNLSQSVLLVAYELFNVKNKQNSRVLVDKASKKQLFNFFKILVSSLDNKSFFKVKEKKKLMIRNIKVIFQKADLTNKEVRTILGIISALKK